MNKDQQLKVYFRPILAALYLFSQMTPERSHMTYMYHMWLITIHLDVVNNIVTCSDTMAKSYYFHIIVFPHQAISTKLQIYLATLEIGQSWTKLSFSSHCYSYSNEGYYFDVYCENGKEACLWRKINIAIGHSDQAYC